MRRPHVRSLAVLGGILALAMVPVNVVAGPDHRGGVIYDSTVTPLPGNLPSVGAEAYSFTEFGDEVTFVGHSRVLRQVTVTLSSWAYQAGNWHDDNCVTSKGATFVTPITFNLYQPATVAGVPTAGSLIVSQTDVFTIPYRPSADDVHCNFVNADTGAGPPSGEWFDGNKGCFNGIAANITFDFSAQNVALPDTVVFGIAYDTSDYGPHPISVSLCRTTPEGCSYDSLNIGLAPRVKVGSKPFPNTVFQNAVYPGDYCDNGAAGIALLREDSPSNACWAGYVPAVQFTAEQS